jgi:hypothetical protein
MSCPSTFAGGQKRRALRRISSFPSWNGLARATTRVVSAYGARARVAPNASEPAPNSGVCCCRHKSPPVLATFTIGRGQNQHLFSINRSFAHTGYLVGQWAPWGENGSVVSPLWRTARHLAPSARVLVVCRSNGSAPSRAAQTDSLGCPRGDDGGVRWGLSAAGVGVGALAAGEFDVVSGVAGGVG